MASGPRVSVGLPVFNGERYLAETLDSILGQDFENFELLIADNASTDATSQIVQSRAADDRRITYLSSETNHGAAWNYNRLVDHARGDLFKWASSDDLLEPGYLEACVTVFDKAGSTGQPSLVYPRTMLINADGGDRKLYEDGIACLSMSASDRVDMLCRNLGLANAVFGVIPTRTLTNSVRIGRYNGSDLTLLLELALHGPIFEVPEVLFRRRVHGNMSGRANATAKDLRTWFTGTAESTIRFPRTRLYAEMVRVAASAPLPPMERARCLGVLARRWGPKYGRSAMAETMEAARQTLFRAT